MRFWLSGPRVFGIRPGVSFGPQDFSRTGLHSASTAGGYVYVVERSGDHRVKIGSSVNPFNRLASLQTGSADPLSIAYTLYVLGDHVAVEREAHTLLGRHRGLGEWFAVTPDVAVAAINAAAFRIAPTSTQSALAPASWNSFLLWTALGIPFWLAVSQHWPAAAIIYLSGVGAWISARALSARRPPSMLALVGTVGLALVTAPVVTAALLAFSQR